MSEFDINKTENTVTIPFDINSTRSSASGKTIVLATSNGFQWVEINGEKVGISFNIVKKK
jgi:hypothetical protein